MLEGADPDWKYWFCLHANETLLRLEHTPKLVVAALNGHCVGGGLEVALRHLGGRTDDGEHVANSGLPESCRDTELHGDLFDDVAAGSGSSVGKVLHFEVPRVANESF